MYRAKVVSNFSAAHFLRNYHGKCENLHGHNWKVEVIAASDALNAQGMVIDFLDLKAMAKDILGALDHKNLNELEYFKKHNPSSEEIARYIFIELEDRLNNRDCKLDKIKVWETDTSCATYSK